MTRKIFDRMRCALILLALLPAWASAGPCDALFRFDGDLTDGSGNEYNALLLDETNTPTKGIGSYAAGKFGQAIRLSGNEVVIAPLDLHFEHCPQVTIVAWVFVEAELPQQMTVVSTGFGSGPRLAMTKANISSWGGTNEIRTRGGNIPEVGVWTPIIGTWDYEAGIHTLHRPDTDPQSEPLGSYSRLPQQDFWVGAHAYNSSLFSITSEVLIDDLRVYGRVLDEQEISAIQAGNPPVVTGNTGSSELTPQQPLSGTLPGSTGSGGLGDSDFPTPIPGMSERLPTIELTMNTDNLEGGSTDILRDFGSDSADNGIELLDAPEGLGAGSGARDPELIAPGGPADQLQEDLETMQENAQKQLEEKLKQEYQRDFGPRDRAQVVNAMDWDLAYATEPSQVVVGTGAFSSLTTILESWIASGREIREIFRVSGTKIIIAVADDGTIAAKGTDPSGTSLPVQRELARLASLDKPIDLVADQMGDYLIISGTEVYASGVPQGAVDWAEAELTDGIQVTAMALLNGEAWIGVSNREVGSGGMNRAHWGWNLLADVERFVAAGERIEDIFAPVSSVGEKWGIATDKRIFIRGEPRCERYEGFGNEVESKLSRTWDCFYAERNCLAGRATWSEQDMRSNADSNIWEVNLLVTIGATEYDQGPKARDDFECWLEEGLKRTELLFGDSPRLKLRLRTQRKTRVDGMDLSEFIMETDSEYSNYMDRNFDAMAKSKTEGYYQVLISNRICIGWDEKDVKRHCIGGRAKFPHSVSPLTRKHGIIMIYPDDRDHVMAHEFGHYLGLIHTFQKTSPFSTALECNFEFLTEGVENLQCSSCRNGIINSTDESCSGDYNVMDYCGGDNDRANLNQCQEDRAATQRNRYLTNDGYTNYFKMKGRLGEPYCTDDSDCFNDEYCNKGVLTAGRNVCKVKLEKGAACSRSGQCESDKCSLFVCRAN